jgi:hypothetical protein
MANTLGTNNLVGTLVTASDLLNAKTLSNPAASGTGLPASYTPGATVVLSGAASTNVYAVGEPVEFFVYATSTSGTPVVSLNVGASPTGPWTALGQATLVANTRSCFSAAASAVPYVAPTNTIGLPSASSPAGSIVNPYWMLAFSTGVTLSELAVEAKVLLSQGEDFVSATAGANAPLNQPTGSSGTETVGYGTGTYTITTLN